MPDFICLDCLFTGDSDQFPTQPTVMDSDGVTVYYYYCPSCGSGSIEDYEEEIPLLTEEEA